MVNFVVGVLRFFFGFGFGVGFWGDLFFCIRRVLVSGGCGGFKGVGVVFGDLIV